MLIKGDHQTSAFCTLFNHVLLATSRYSEDYPIRIVHFSQQIWFYEVRFLLYYQHVTLITFSGSVIKVFYPLHLLTLGGWLMVNRAFTAVWHPPKVHEHVALFRLISVYIMQGFLFSIFHHALRNQFFTPLHHCVFKCSSLYSLIQYVVFLKLFSK